MFVHSHAAFYRPDIDGLRALAVVPVILCHAGVPWFSGGFVGVDIFFVISGYLITGIIWRDLQKRQFSVGDFFARRIRRILPALFTTVAMSCIAAYIILIPTEFVVFAKAIIATMLFYQNFNLLAEAGYFDVAAIEKPLNHTWSLSVEEQFYAFWPLFLILASRVLKRRYLLWVVLGLAAISLALAQLKLSGHPKDVFLVSYYRIWELLVGAALALFPVRLPNTRSATVAGGLGVIGICAAIFSYSPSTPFPAFAALIPCLGATLILCAGDRTNPISALLSAKLFQSVGLISYSLYLVHWPVLSLFHLYFYRTLSMLEQITLIGLIFVFGCLLFKYVETPFRRGPLRPTRLYLSGALGASILIFAAETIISWGGFPHRVDATVLEAQEAAKNKYPESCTHISIPNVSGGGCVFGRQKGQDYDLVLWGDSHAAHYLPAIAKLAEQNDLSGVLFGRGGCAPLVGDTRASLDCFKFSNSVSDWIKGQKSVRLVILAARWTFQRTKFQNMANGSQDMRIGGLFSTLEMLNELKAHTVIIGQVPDYELSVTTCIAYARFHNPSAEKDCVTQPITRVRLRFLFMMEYIGSLKGRFNFDFVDPLPAFCDADLCTAIRDKTILMTDNNHLSEAGALRFYASVNIPGLNRVQENSSLESGRNMGSSN